MSDVLALPVPRLQVVGLSAGYGPVPVLFDVSLTVSPGTIVALLGPNGAGKTTTLRAVAGVLRCPSGSVLLDGLPIAGLRAERIARLGVQYIPEGGGLLRSLTVTDNLLLAGRVATRRRRELDARLERVWARFPALASRRRQPASTLSGGERQMLSLAQAVMTDARLLLLDEASLGLAPQMVTALFEIVTALRDEGRSVLLVEQNAHLALEVADHAYVMEKGRVQTLDREGDLANAYLGGADRGALPVT